MEKNYDILLEKAKWDKLTSEEISYVADQIENHPQENGDLYTLIYTLGRAWAREYRTLIERFLEYPKDPMISRIALQTLCDFWDFTDEYIDRVKEFAKGIIWDNGDDVRDMAISILGEYCRVHKDINSFQILINIFEDKNCSQVTRSIAYDEIAQAMGKTPQELPAFKELAEFLSHPEIIDQEVLKKASRIIENKEDFH